MTDESLVQAVLAELERRGVALDDSIIEHVWGTVTTHAERGLPREPRAIADDMMVSD